MYKPRKADRCVCCNDIIPARPKEMQIDPEDEFICNSCIDLFAEDKDTNSYDPYGYTYTGDPDRISLDDLDNLIYSTGVTKPKFIE